jgi:hypothetical protein
MKSMKLTARIAAAAVFAFGLFALTGCEPGWAGKDTPQGKELESILMRQRQVPTEAPAELGLSFAPVEVERSTESNGAVRYRAALVWKMTDAPEAAQARLQQLVLAKRPDLGGREVKSVVLALEYRDANDKKCGTDQVELGLKDGQGRVYLPDLGKDGSPVRIVGTVESFTVVEREVKVSMK